MSKGTTHDFVESERSERLKARRERLRERYRGLEGVEWGLESVSRGSKRVLGSSRAFRSLLRVDGAPTRARTKKERKKNSPTNNERD